MFLLLGSAIGSGTAALASKYLVTHSESEAATIFLIVAALLALNWFYILKSTMPGQPQSRLSRMVSLWFAAKEKELERRSTAAD